jgi:hypothetical protein
MNDRTIKTFDCNPDLFPKVAAWVERIESSGVRGALSHAIRRLIEQDYDQTGKIAAETQAIKDLQQEILNIKIQLKTISESGFKVIDPKTNTEVTIEEHLKPITATVEEVTGGFLASRYNLK